MIRNHLSLLSVGFGLVLAGGLAQAHHSETAEFDSTKPVKVSGTLAKVEWQNPHVWIFVDVRDEAGKVVTWGFSTAPPGALMRRGVTKDLLKLGAAVDVEGSRARDGSNNASIRRLMYADGKNVLAPPEDGR